jgi:hypothetical protein
MGGREGGFWVMEAEIFFYVYMVNELINYSIKV